MSRRSLGTDVALAVALAVIACLEAAGHADDGYRGTAPPVVGGLVAAVAVLPLAARRRRPIAVLAAVSGLVGLPHLVLSYDPVFVGGCVPVVIAAGTVGRLSPRPAARWALLAPLPPLVVMAAVIPGFAATAPVFAALILAGWTLGVLVRALAERRGALRRELVALESAETLRLEGAVTAERTRIARDLHDVIAHCVSLMVLQAGAARLQIATDTAASAAAIEQVERTGHEALVELQRVLGLLRGDEGADPSASVGALDRLVEEVRLAGLDVALQVEGDPSALPRGLDRSLYRVVQESLTNALKHGDGGPVDVRLAVAAGRVELQVENATAAAARVALPGGNGQAGMRERVAAFGGALTAGVEQGRYRVHAVVPVGEPA